MRRGHDLEMGLSVMIARITSTTRFSAPGWIPFSISSMSTREGPTGTREGQYHPKGEERAFACVHGGDVLLRLHVKAKLIRARSPEPPFEPSTPNLTLSTWGTTFLSRS